MKWLLHWLLNCIYIDGSRAQMRLDFEAAEDKNKSGELENVDEVRVLGYGNKTNNLSRGK